MSTILVATPAGDLVLPADLLPEAARSGRFLVEARTGSLVVSPVDELAARRATMTPQERVRDLREWVSQPRPPAPSLPDECLRRENIYD